MELITSLLFTCHRLKFFNSSQLLIDVINLVFGLVTIVSKLVIISELEARTGNEDKKTDKWQCKLYIQIWCA